MLLYTNKYCICIWWIKKSWAYGTGWWLIETANIQFRQSAYWHTNMWISGGWTVHLDLSLFKRFVCPGGPPVKKPPQKGNLKVESKVRWNSLQACWDVILILKYTSQQRPGTFLYRGGGPVLCRVLSSVLCRVLSSPPPGRASACRPIVAV